MNTCKKVLSMLLAIMVVLSCGCMVSAAKAETGKCGKNATWALQNGTLTISGKGSIYNYGWRGCPWYDQRQSIKRVVIEEGIRYAGSAMLYQCSNVKTIQLPQTLTAIGNEAFIYCGVQKMKLPDNVKRIGTSAFERCPDLKEIIFPRKVNAFGENVLFYCSSLERVVLPKNLEELPGGTFSRCFRLRDLELPQGITRIGDFAFDQTCGLKTLRIPESVTEIGECAFMRSCLRELTVPASVKQIGAEAFRMSDHLKTLTIMNPDCDIKTVQDSSTDGDLLIIPATTVLRSYKGSTAEAYAEKYGLTFQSIEKKTVPEKPANLQVVTEGKKTSLKLIWNTPGTAKGYQVFRSTNGKAGSYERIAVVRNAEYMDKGLESGTTYYYAVRAYNKQNGKYVYSAYTKANQTTR